MKREDTRPEATEAFFGEREPRKIEDYRADAPYLDDEEADLIEAWDYLFTRYKEAERRADQVEAQLAAQAVELRELQEALIGAAKLVDAIGQWFIEADPEVPKWFEDAVLEIERTVRAGLSTPEAEPPA